MRRVARRLLGGAVLLLLLAAGGALAETRRQLDVTLDPARPAVQVADRIPVTPAAGFDLLLLPGFALRAQGADGGDRTVTRLGAEPGRPLERWRVALATTDREIRLRYGGPLPRLTQEADPRRVLAMRAPAASPEGSFLPADSGWYALTPFAVDGFDITLRLPQGQRGVVPGDLVEDGEDGDGYRARFAFPIGEEGIDLVAGPLRVEERRAGGVRIRTYFPDDLGAESAGYLEDAARHLARFSALIGPYPYAGFSIVAGPLPTGLAMPGFTYVGAQVLRLPFVRAVSLPHEVLHNWWGNGVRVDVRGGNWAEGLTTYMADYAVRAEEGPAAAREARLAWLRDLNALAPGAAAPLRRFAARHHGASQIVGYQRAAYLFLMAEDRIGGAAFTAALRAFWRDFQGREANWADLEQALATAAATPLGRLFSDGLDRTDLPAVALDAVRVEGTRLHLALSQAAPPYDLRVPVRVRTATGETWLNVDLSDTSATLEAALDSPPLAVAIDPDYRLLRRLAPGELPPILREAMVDPATRVLVLDSADGYRQAALDLAARLLDAGPELTASGAAGPLLAVGPAAAIARLRAERRLAPLPGALPPGGDVRAWAERDAAGAPLLLVQAEDAAGVRSALRALPHYGRASLVALVAGRVILNQVWPPGRSPLEWRAGD